MVGCLSYQFENNAHNYILDFKSLAADMAKRTGNINMLIKDVLFEVRTLLIDIRL